MFSPPKMSNDQKNCSNCYWLRFQKGTVRTRCCTYPGPIELGTVEIPVEGDEPIRVKQCLMWKDCGLLGTGIQKRLV